MSATSGGLLNDTNVQKDETGASVSAVQTAQPVTSGSTGRAQRRRRSKGDYRAKQWTYLIETLKRTVDCIYETCRVDQSVIECKEALMYLSSSARDFETLIKSINVELDWDAAEKPHAVAWEVRKTMTSPNKGLHPLLETDGNAVVSVLQIPLMLPGPKAQSDSVADKDQKKTPDPPLATTSTTAGNQENEKDDDDGWNLVTNKRNKGATRKSPSVYERLSGRPGNYSETSKQSATKTGWRPTIATGRLMCPKSAMDLPQTKASMAKMAYSRQLLWQRNRMVLAEKMQQRRRAETAAFRKSGSMPSLSRIGINFADPNAVRRSAQAYMQQCQDSKAAQLSRKTPTICRRTLRSIGGSLESIKELAVEADEEREPPPSDPKPNLETSGLSRLMPICTRSEPVDDRLPSMPPDMDDDDEWQAMTEEEESLAQEEESLKKEIEEEENHSIDAELERQVAAEAEELDLLSVPDAPVPTKPPRQTQKISWQDIVNGWQLEMESFASISWSELVEREITHYRAPGEAAQMHEKLSSPSRKRNQEDVGRRHEERLAKADDLRLRLQAQKAKRLRELSNKVDEVRMKREKLIEKKRALLESRMEKAEENRRKNLDDIVRRARDDDLKVQEINFINTLEAGNMRHDLLVRHQDHEQRIQSIHVERLKRSKEKAAKEAAAEERRRLADGERQTRLREMAEKKRLRYDQIEVLKTEHERDRIHAAKEKQRQHKERIADMKAAEHAESEKLKQKIQQKIVDSSRRHEESLEMVKQKAVELCSPRPVDSWVVLADWNVPPKADPYESPKSCAVCKILIRSDLLLVGHLCGVEHRKKRNLSTDISEESLKVDMEFSIIESAPVVDTPNEEVVPPDPDRSKSLLQKKRRQKLRQKLIAKAKEIEPDLAQSKLADGYVGNSAIKTACDKPLRELRRIVESPAFESKCDDSDVHTLERALGEVGRTLAASQQNSTARDSLRKGIWSSGGFDALLSLIKALEKDVPVVPSRTSLKACHLLDDLCSESPFLAVQLLCSQRLLIVLDSLAASTKALAHEDGKKEAKTSKNGAESVALWKLVASVVKTLDRDEAWWTTNLTGGRDVFVGRAALLSSYLALSGFVESATHAIQLRVIGASGADGDPLSVLVDLIATVLLVTGEREARSGVATDKCGAFSPALKESRLLGLPAVLYRLLCAENLTYDRNTPAELSKELLQMVNQTLRLFNTLALVDKALLEDCLDDEEMVVMLAHSFAVLLTWLSRMIDIDAMDILLHRVLVAVGHFAAISQRAQALTVLGGQHSIVQQLCVLPFRYFSDPALMRLLFPSLIACCFRRSTAVSLLKQELSPKSLSAFITEQSSSTETQSATVDAPAFASRFPKKLWPEAIAFFENA